MPAQIAPGRWLATGAGELLEGLADPNPEWFGLLILPLAAELSTAAVYAEADGWAGPRGYEALADRRRALRGALELSAPVPAASELLENDLQQAAISLCPEIVRALEEAREAGAEIALVSGSGPTVVGLFPARQRARPGPARRGGPVASRLPAPVCATPVDASYARASDGVSHNEAEQMSRTAINDLVAVCAGVFGLALYAGLILVPAWSAYSRLWERVAASILSLYVLAVLVGIGVAGALAVVYFWG